RGGLPVQGARPPRRPASPPYRRRGLFVGLALVVVALTAGLAARRIVSAGYFEVGTPAVSGVAMVTADAVVQAADARGRQLWEIDDAAIERSVAAIPGVKSAEVSRSWPNHVTIAVEERLPAAVWRLGAVELVVDGEGYVLNAPVMGGMPAIRHLDGTPSLGIGDHVDGDAVQLATELTDRVPAATGHHVSRFEYSSSGGLDVVTDRGLRIRFGDSQNIDYKLELWQQIAEQAKKASITPSEIDLRFGQWAAVR
ncbi:MAG: cell division protein FtsQ/DivIB, partial [Dehalococcoidia bacterium]